MEQNDVSIQDRLFPHLLCFGCGPANTQGLRLKSFVTGEGVVADFLPGAHLDNGGGVLNGGIITTLLDCHGGAAVMHRAEIEDGEAGIWVTAAIDVRFIRPIPLHETCHLTADILSRDGREMNVTTKIHVGEKVGAAATARWVMPRSAHP